MEREIQSDKLTIQEAAMYLGQRVQITRRNENPTETDKLVGVDIEEGYISTSRYIIEYQEDKTIQLLLRLIEDMTEEEKKELDKIHQKIIDSYSVKEESPCTSLLRLKVNASSAITNYLRSIGVDCDELIKQGKAIRKETK